MGWLRFWSLLATPFWTPLALRDRDFIDRTHLEQHIANYAALTPTHLTATPADLATSAWIADELTALDLHVETQAYTILGGPLWIPRDDSFGCSLQLDDVAVPCYLVQRPPLGDHVWRRIPKHRVLVRTDMSGAYIFTAEDVYREYILPNGTLPFDAAIVVNGAGDSVSQPRPFDWHQATALAPRIPVVTVSPGSLKALHSARQIASLSLQGDWLEDAASRNVLVRQRRPLPENCEGPAAPLYIGTPINGFFRAAGERGPGIAMLLELAKDLVERPPECAMLHAPVCRDVILGFTSGHEMGDPGIDLGVFPYLRERAALANVSLSSVPFVSVGANIGMYASFAGAIHEGEGTGVGELNAATSVEGDATLALLLRQFTESTPFARSRPQSMNLTNTQGAVVQALKEGMPAMNLAGSSWQRFHLPADAGIDSVNMTALEIATKAFSSALRVALCGSSSELSIFV